MPPVRHRPLGILPRQSTWHVGSDDFALPSMVAIVSRLILLSLMLATQIYLLVPPTGCEDSDMTIPPLFYISLSIFNLVLFLTIINEGVIFSVSLRGQITDTTNRRKFFPYVVEVRVVLMFVEIITLIVTTVGTFDGSVGGNAIECELYREGPLVFAKVIVCLTWALVLILGLALLYALDPLGFCSPSIIKEVAHSEDLGGEEDEEGFIVPGKFGTDHTDDGTGDGSRRRKYHVELGHRKIFRRFKALCCCIGNNRSSTVAMRDAAQLLHTIFGDLDFVPSDVVAGLILLRRDQRQKKDNCFCPVCMKREEGSCECLTKDLRDLTFEHMPKGQIPSNYVRHKQRPFNFDDPVERALFEDVDYYMHYSMGIYGWSLHLFQNPFTGLCRLGSATCCRCNYSCLNSRAGVDFVQDNFCLCGLATMRIQSKRREDDIVFATYQNEVYQTPFSLSVDHDRKTVVLAVRGTLSMKDVLTDISVSMVKVKVPGLESDDLYIHNGMYRTAQWVKGMVHTRKRGEAVVMSIGESREDLANEMKEGAGPSKGGSSGECRQILRTTMQKYWDYKLIVTGHSLGASVASVLSVLLKPAYPHLHCFAYSPPGCIFSLPVAQHSESFITTIVLGNDLIPRTSFRSFLFLKKQLEHLVKNCQKPKPQVLFQSQRMERLFSKVTENPTVSIDDVKEHLVPDRRPLGITEITIAKKFAKKAKRNFQTRKTLHVYIRKINQGDHIASFPPGRLLHMEFTRNTKPLFLGLCYPSEMKLTWKSFEDFSSIAVDKGMVEDHLPMAVVAGLRRIKKQFIGQRYDPKETERIRIDASNEYRQREACIRREESFNENTHEGGNGSMREDVVVTLEEIGTRVSGSAPEDRPQFEQTPLHEQPLAGGATARASAFLQALGQPQSPPVSGQPQLTTSQDLALEMEITV